MAVLKEYTCRKCGHEFEAFVPVCAKCGYDSKDNRAFRPAFGINGGDATANSARRIDRILENEFARQGISDFSNRGGINRVEYQRLRSRAPGVYATPMPGVETPPIAAGFVKGGLSNPDLGGLTQEGRPWSPPADGAGVSARYAGQPVQRPNQLAARTRVVGRTDNRGNQIG